MRKAKGTHPAGVAPFKELPKPPTLTSVNVSFTHPSSKLQRNPGNALFPLGPMLPGIKAGYLSKEGGEMDAG